MKIRRVKWRWKRYHTAKTEEAFRNVRVRKKKVLCKHKMKKHRAHIIKAVVTDHGIWRIAKWIKMRNNKTKTFKKIPTFVKKDFFAEFTANKLQILRDFFFFTFSSSDMFDTLQYSDRMHNSKIHITEVAAVLNKTLLRKASELNQILNHILHRAKT